MFAHVLTLQASQEWSELEETAGEGFKVVGRVREEMREKVKKEEETQPPQHTIIISF